jgi:hypothetical protein
VAIPGGPKHMGSAYVWQFRLGTRVLGLAGSSLINFVED